MKNVRIPILLTLATCLIFALLACEQKEAPKGEIISSPTPDDVQTKTMEVDVNAPGQAADPAAVQTAAKMMAGSHVLLAYKGAMRARPTVTRTKEEAKAIADKLHKEALKDSTKIEELAKKWSDCPSGQMGGDLGMWQKGQMVPEFDKALETLKPGQVAPQVIETPFGFHVIRANKPIAQIQLAADHLFVSHKDSIRFMPEIKRTREEAQKRILEALAKIKKDPAKFKEIAKEYSDDPHISFPTWTTGAGQMPLDFEKPVMALKIGQIVDKPIETGFGFHIFKRVELPPRLAGSHVLVQHNQSVGKHMADMRSKAEAKKRAGEIYAKLQEKPERFEEMADKYSDDVTTKTSHGDLGSWTKGAMVEEFDSAVLSLKAGEISKPIETVFGWHIIRRNDLAKANPQILGTPPQQPTPEVMERFEQMSDGSDKKQKDIPVE